MLRAHALPVTPAHDGSPPSASTGSDPASRRRPPRPRAQNSQSGVFSSCAPTSASCSTADFWYMRDGKIQEFNCHIGTTTMFAQLGVLPDFTSAVAASAPAR
jgi:hypothetical protein